MGSMQKAGDLGVDLVHNLPVALLPLPGLRHDFPCERQEPFLHQNSHKYDGECFVIGCAIQDQQSTVLVPIGQGVLQKPLGILQSQPASRCQSSVASGVHSWSFCGGCSMLKRSCKTSATHCITAWPASTIPKMASAKLSCRYWCISLQTSLTRVSPLSE